LFLSLDTHFEFSLATSTSLAPDPARYKKARLFKAAGAELKEVEEKENPKENGKERVD
jgi:hypothetical protein